MVEVPIHTTDTGELKDRKDFCSMSKQLQRKLGVEKRQHIRVDHPPLATYYRVYNFHEDNEKPLVVREDGLTRFGVEEGAEVKLTPTVPQETFMEARRTGGMAETVWDQNSQDKVLVTAPHGGDIEFGTDDMAVRLYKLLEKEGVPVSFWACHGFNQQAQRGSAFRRWHISKPTDSTQSYPGLQQVADRKYDHVITFHLQKLKVYSVGGQANDQVRDGVANRLDQLLGFEAKTDVNNMPNPGTHSRVSTNALSKNGGLHIELPREACYKKRRTVAIRVKKELLNHL